MLFRIASAAVIVGLLSSFAGVGSAEPSIQTITIKAKRFSFSPSEITLKKGEPVKLSLTSDDVPHSLVIKELNVNANIAKGHSTEVTVTPGQTGDFKGVCGRFCGMGHGSMRLIVHVTDK